MPVWSTFPLRSALNGGEFEVRVIAHCTIYSNSADEISYMHALNPFTERTKVISVLVVEGNMSGDIS